MMNIVIFSLNVNHFYYFLTIFIVMSKYERFNHAKTFLRYHLIFSTKYRRKVLNPISDDLLAAMKEAESMNGNFHIEIDEVDQDHIHLLVRIKPSESIDKVVYALKQQSTYMMWKLHHDFLRIYYWSGQHHLWTRGYFASTIGDVSEKTLVQYIKNQG